MLYGLYHDVPRGTNPVDVALNNLNDRITAVEKRVDDLDALRHRRFIFIGDSYATGYNPADPLNPITGWPDFVCQTLGIDDENKHVYAADGAGFTSFGESGKTFYNLLQDAYTDLFDQAYYITDIVIGGGFNDRSYISQTTLDKAAAFMAGAVASFENARVHLFPIGWSTDVDMRRLCFDLYGFIFAQTPEYRYIYHNGTYAAIHRADAFNIDGVHPSLFGQQLLAREIANVLSGGDSIDTTNYSVTIQDKQIAFTNRHADRIGVTFTNEGLTVSGGELTIGDNDFGLITGGYVLGWSPYAFGYQMWVAVDTGVIPVIIRFERQNDGVHLIVNNVFGEDITTNNMWFLNGNNDVAALYV